MAAVPVDNPVTIPVEPTLATEVLPLHTPPEKASVRCTVVPTHKMIVPLIGKGVALTVTTTLALQPDGTM